MLKIFASLGQATNTQIFSNKTIYEADIIINSSGKSYTAHLLSLTNYTIPVTRNEIGEVTAFVTIKYSNGSEIEFTFRVSPKNCTDYCDLYDTYVIYNRERRGMVTKLPILVPTVILRPEFTQNSDLLNLF